MPILVEGTTPAPITVATFRDAAGTYNTVYNTSINWGDGSQPTSGMVTYTGSNFLVQAGHPYANEGNYLLSATITNTANNTTTTVSGLAIVNDAALTPMSGGNLQATQGSTFSGFLGSFTDGSFNAPSSDFSALVDWGDGTPQTPATLSGGPGTFGLSGSHVWTTGGNFNITVNISDIGGSQTSFTDTATVTPVTPPVGVSVMPGAANGAVISQVYLAGGQSNSAFVQDYVELLNTNTTPVNLSGWSLQYADVGSGTWQTGRDWPGASMQPCEPGGSGTGAPALSYRETGRELRCSHANVSVRQLTRACAAEKKQPWCGLSTLVRRPGLHSLARTTHAAASFCSLRRITTGSGFRGGTGRPCSTSNSTCSFMPQRAWYRQSSTECPLPVKPSSSEE